MSLSTALSPDDGAWYWLSNDLGKNMPNATVNNANSDKTKNGKYWLKGNPRASALPAPLTFDKLQENKAPLTEGESNLTINKTREYFFFVNYNVLVEMGK